MREPILQACLGKQRVSCRRGTLTQIHQGVAIGRKRSSNNLLISESTALPDDETYKDEQYMQRITEQVQKIVTTERVLKDDSPKDYIPSEKAAKKIHEAGNCELFEVQQRTNEVQCRRCYSYIRGWISSMPMRRTTEHVGRYALQHKTIFF